MAEVSAIHKYIIEKVKERRKALSITSADLSFKLGKADSYVSVIESYSNDKHYNIDLLNDIAKVLDCSPRDFWPEKAL